MSGEEKTLRRLLRAAARRLVHGPALAQPTFDGKMFGIGFHKTGTSSLATALRILGYQTAHGDPRKSEHGGDEGWSLLKLIEAGNYNLPTLDYYQAFTDNPYFSIWRHLAERYPDAKFILTERDEDAWIRSCLRYYAGRRIRPMRQWMFGEHADPSRSEEARAAWLARYRDHNAAVRSHFGRESHRFLIMNIEAGDGWAKLCPLLGATPLTVPFPHANQTSTNRRRQAC